MNGVAFDITQLRHPVSNVFSIGIESLTLSQWVEDAEIRLRVHASAGSKSPPTVVGRKVAVYQMLHEEPLASTPVDHQVLGQKGRDHHARAIMHPGTVLQLSHGSIDNGEPGLAVAPSLEVIRIILPFNVGGFGLETLVHAANFC